MQPMIILCTFPYCIRTIIAVALLVVEFSAIGRRRFWSPTFRHGRSWDLAHSLIFAILWLLLAGSYHWIIKTTELMDYLGKENRHVNFVQITKPKRNKREFGLSLFPDYSCTLSPSLAGIIESLLHSVIFNR
jgi:hypothetical protein